MAYHLAGFASAFFVFLSVSGVAAQLLLVWKRKKQISAGDLVGEQATSVLSITRFATSFSGVFAMFFYGITLDGGNYYLVVPRIFILLILLWILFEVMRDRKTMTSKTVFWGGLGVVILASWLPFSGNQSAFFNTGIPHILVLLGNSAFVIGAGVQIYVVRQKGKTGALSLPMHQLNSVKDIASLLFGVIIGAAHGWPIIFAHFMSLIMQLTTIYHFRWVKVSKIAKVRRERGSA